MKRTQSVKSIGRTAIMLVIAVGMSVVATQPARAQVSNLNDGQFVKGLAERGMQDLVIFFLKKYPPSDPKLKLEILVEQSKMLYRDEGRSDDQRMAARDEAVRAYTALIQNYPNDEIRVLWGADLSELVLSSVLPDSLADNFFEFGRPTLDQEKVFVEQATLAMNLMAKVRNDWGRLELDIPRRTDFEQRFENTGVWDTLRNEYGSIRVPFYYAWATLYASMLPLDSPLYANARGKPENARNAMLTQAIEGLKKLIENIGDQYNTYSRMMSLLGRLQYQAGIYDDAIRSLKEAGDAETQPYLNLLVRLAQAQSLFKGRQKGDAKVLFENLCRHETVQSNMLFGILLADAESRLGEDVASIYGPYEQLLDRAEGEARQQAEEYLFDRFYERYDPATQNLAQMPPMVAMAVGVKAKQAGLKAQQAGNKEEQTKHLTTAMDVLTKLLARQDLSPSAQGKAMFELGSTYYLMDKPFDAAKTFIHMAWNFKDAPEAEKAAGFGLELAGKIYELQRVTGKDQDLLNQAANFYEQATLVLLEAFGQSELAETHRYTYATFLRERERFKEAATQYAMVNTNHKYYPESLYERLISLQSVWEETEEEAKQIVAEQMVEVGDQYLGIVDSVIASSDDTERRKRLLEYEGFAVVMKGDAMIETLSQTDPDMFPETLGMLEGFDEKFKDYPDIVGQAMRLRIRVRQQQEDFATARSLLERYMNAQPEYAGPTVSSVLKSLRAQIAALVKRRDTYRDQRAGQKAEQLATIAMDLAQMLLNWAENQPQIKPAMMLGFRINLGEVQLAAGQHQPAVQTFEELFEELPNEGRVIEGLAEAYFKAQLLEKAGENYNKLIKNLPKKSGRTYWNAWMRRLQIVDMMTPQGQQNNNIYLRVRQLEKDDETLGGEPFITELQRLYAKHAPR